MRTHLSNKNGPGAAATAHRAMESHSIQEGNSVHNDTSRLTDRQLDEIADQAAQARALADIAEAKAATYVPRPGHRIEFYIRRATPSGRVEIDVDEGLVQRVDTETGCVVIGDDDVPDWFVPLADVVGRIPGGLAANISRFVCWVRGNYGNAVHAADLLEVLRAVQFDSEQIQQAALRAAADRIIRRRSEGVTMTAADLLEYVDSLPATSEPPVDRIVRRAAKSAPEVRQVREIPDAEHPVSCDDCGRLVAVSPYPVPPLTIRCRDCA